MNQEQAQRFFMAAGYSSAMARMKARVWLKARVHWKSGGDRLDMLQMVRRAHRNMALRQMAANETAGGK